MIPVIIESPYKGDHETHERYLNQCLSDSIKRGEAPFASHGLYTRQGVLNDNRSEERDQGIQAGFAWRNLAAYTAVYIDLGVSEGMVKGVADALVKNKPIVVRSLYKTQTLEDFEFVMAKAVPMAKKQLKKIAEEQNKTLIERC